MSLSIYAASTQVPEAASVLIQLWRESRSVSDWSNQALHDSNKDLACMSSLVDTPCLPDSDGDTTDEEVVEAGGKLTWKQLRNLGWSYVPGSRLGESLIDFYYLAPGVNVERAIKNENAFYSMDQVRAYLVGGELPSELCSEGLGKRRRDSPSSEDQAEALVTSTPKHSRQHSKLICGVMSKRGIPCPQRSGSCPYHSMTASDLEQNEEDPEDEAMEEEDLGLCGVVSQRGLPCPHRREVCPYHTDAQRAMTQHTDDSPHLSQRDLDAKRTRSSAKKDDDSASFPSLSEHVDPKPTDRMAGQQAPLDDRATSSPEDSELCGVISQRGLSCSHRKQTCPYHSKNRSRRARDARKAAEATAEPTELSEKGEEASLVPTQSSRGKDILLFTPLEMEGSVEDGKLSWKDIRRQGWSYVPGSRLGESLIDYFYLAPDVAVESAVKYKNAFESMEQVQAYLSGEELQPTAQQMEGKRRRDSPRGKSPELRESSRGKKHSDDGIAEGGEDVQSGSGSDSITRRSNTGSHNAQPCGTASVPDVGADKPTKRALNESDSNVQSRS